MMMTVPVAFGRSVLLLLFATIHYGSFAQRPEPPGTKPPVTVRPSYAGSYYIKSRSTQRYLDVRGDNPAAGAEIRLYPFNATKAQVFTFEDAGNDHYRIRSHSSGLYVTLDRHQAAAEGQAGAGGVSYKLTQRPLAVARPQDSASIWPASGSQLWRIAPSTDTTANLILNRNVAARALQAGSNNEVSSRAKDGRAPQQWIIKQAFLREHPSSATAELGIGAECFYDFTVYWFIHMTLPNNLFAVLPEWRGVGDARPRIDGRRADFPLHA